MQSLVLVEYEIGSIVHRSQARTDDGDGEERRNAPGPMPVPRRDENFFLLDIREQW